MILAQARSTRSGLFSLTTTSGGNFRDLMIPVRTSLRGVVSSGYHLTMHFDWADVFGPGSLPSSGMIFLLDNYDSFTFNLVQRIGEIDPTAEIRVERNDQITLEEIEALSPERIIISPGPCSPAEAGLSRDIIAHFGPKMPVLGVCLGHQCLADVYGAKVVRANRLMHGKTSMISHTGEGVFAGLPNPFQATRYHSLIVPKETVPDCLKITAWVHDDGQTSKSWAFSIASTRFTECSFIPRVFSRRRATTCWGIF